MSAIITEIPVSPLLSPKALKRISRKPPPKEGEEPVFSEKYPTPDPEDPFAPLAQLRRRRGSNPEIFFPTSRPSSRDAPYKSPLASPKPLQQEWPDVRLQNESRPSSRDATHKSSLPSPKKDWPNFELQSDFRPSSRDASYRSPAAPPKPLHKEWPDFRLPNDNQDRSPLAGYSSDREVRRKSSQSKPHYRLRRPKSADPQGSSKGLSLRPAPDTRPSYRNLQSYVAANNPQNRRKGGYDFDIVLGNGVLRDDSSSATASGWSSRGSSFDQLSLPAEQISSRRPPRSPLPLADDTSSNTSRRLGRFFSGKRSKKSTARSFTSSDASSVPSRASPVAHSPYASSPALSRLQLPMSPLCSELNLDKTPQSVTKDNRATRKVSNSSTLASSSPVSIWASPRDEPRSQSEPPTRQASTASRKRRGTLIKLPRHPSSNPSNKGSQESIRHVDSPVSSTSFLENIPPSREQLALAASLIVIAESGVRVRFGDLWAQQKTVVCFIRHFWCPFCQDYMFAISKDVDPKALRAAGLNLVIISNGSYNMIKSYRQIFGCPYAVYTDPALQLYKTLGMTLKSMSLGPKPKKESYVSHGPISGIAMVIMNAMKFGVPVWEKGGDISQLGGEFIMGPGLTCTYAHRMRNIRGHECIRKVLAAAGIEIKDNSYSESTANTGKKTDEFESEEDKTMRVKAEREKLERLRAKKRILRNEMACNFSQEIGSPVMKFSGLRADDDDDDDDVIMVRPEDEGPVVL